MPPSHHACLVRLPVISVKAALLHYGEVTNFEVRTCSYGTLAISDVRGLIEIAALRPGTKEIQLVIVLAESINFEAQQALLKVLEEPPASTRFLFVLPSGATLIPTLNSRFFVLESSLELRVDNADFQAFNTASYKERMELIAKKMLKKDLLWVANIRAGLEYNITTFSNKKAVTIKLKHYALVLEHLTKRGASNKMLLEELSLLLPEGNGTGSREE